jgi:DNA-binding IclR family transcriptional regulator
MSGPRAGRTADRYGSSTVEKAIEILFAISDSEDGLTNLEVAEALDMDKSTAHRLLSTLERHGLLGRIGSPARFVVGSEAQRLAWGASNDLRLVVEPLLAELAQLTNEAASFSIRRHDQFHCVARRLSPHELTFSPAPGVSYPLHSGATGFALWAFLPPRERDTLLAEGEFDAFTDITVTDRDELRAELDRTAQRGYGTSAGVRSPGGCSIAVPVIGGQGAAVGALALSAAESRVPLEKLIQFHPRLVAAADRIRLDMGWSQSTRAGSAA